MTVRSMRATTPRTTSMIGRRSDSRPAEPANVVQIGAEASVIVNTLGAETIRLHLATARHIYAERRRRHKFLPADLFGEPTWDIMLDLYIAAREDRRVPTTSSCIGAHVPPTTALRWLRILESRGLVEREDDGRDGRRTFVRLTRPGLRAMDDCLASEIRDFARVLHDAEAAHAVAEAAE
ncbi:DNA-binding transcriptional ArsR family regulator [Novosphingobium hassiacum]|uniref:DNA-binding transcriptional ArsR family regulator n=1 Tax=Novosphingobium hassiacum TaxID=173676 RepID=A0A7W5ZTB9_9SPHN|nr:winged helix DNA-binding protein [Novosphingobium hassiacum]MBB3859106.1 DNA-binding transcriptional ArsR family regulator [Novosphingobium hassiacum]